MLSAQYRRHLVCALLALAPLFAAAAELSVSAAASLTNALRELGPAFEAQNPGTRVIFNFGASDTLLAQIARGAPADVFASADEVAMNRAETQRLISPGSRRNFLANTLVMIVPADGALGLKAPTDLLRPDVKRFAVGNPASVPVGRYTKSALEAAALWEAAQAKAVFAQNVRQALDYVARGEVDAGFVYASDALIASGKVRVVTQVPTTTPITYPIAIVAGGPNAEAARSFLNFVLTPAAQAVFARHGFGKP
jgi:molybdate transport system substrate-binding protein